MSNCDRIIKTCKKIVENISKVLLCDLTELKKERTIDGTNNSSRYLSQDFISSYIWKSLLNEKKIYTRIFKVAFNWKILVVIDMVNRVTYTVHNSVTLDIEKGKYPNYLKNIVKAEGHKRIKVAEQISLFDEVDSSTSFLTEANFVNEIREHCSGYRHCVVTYEFKNSEIISMKASLLGVSSCDKLIIEHEQSLLNYIPPIYRSVSLESSYSACDDKKLGAIAEHTDEQSSSQLFKLKKNIMKRSS
ncbi:MAG: DUF5986 family protein [Candidatus Bruticola sp.]